MSALRSSGRFGNMKLQKSQLLGHRVGSIMHMSPAKDNGYKLFSLAAFVPRPEVKAH